MRSPKVYTLSAIGIAALAIAHTMNAWADVSVAPMPEAHAFSINGKPYGIHAFQMLTKGIQQHSSDASDSKVLKGLIENHLFSQASAHEHHDHSHSAQHHRLWQEYGMLLENLFPQVTTDGLRVSCVKNLPFDDKQLMSALGAKANKKAMVEAVISREVIKSAEKITLAEIECDAAEKGNISLAQAIDAADEAASLKLWRGEIDTLELLRNKVSDVKLREGILLKKKIVSVLDLKTLWQTVSDKQARLDYEAEAGVNYELHHSPEGLQALKKTVTDAEIDAYYEDNKKNYQQISKVKARHLTVATQAQADEVVAKIKAGLDFESAIKAYSISEDKNAVPAGDLGIIDRREKNLPFVKKLALILPAGEVSPPFRMPDGKSYEILWVDSRESENLPKNDESVRSEIRTELAHKKAKQRHLQLQKKLWKDADIKINAVYFSEDMVKKWSE